MASVPARALITPPIRLRQLSEGWVRPARALWILLFGFALLADVGGAIYAYRDTYQVQPVFERWGLDYDVEYDGEVALGTAPRADGTQSIQTQARGFSPVIRF